MFTFDHAARLLVGLACLTALPGLSAQETKRIPDDAVPVEIGNFRAYPNAEAVTITPANGNPDGLLRLQTFGPRPSSDSAIQLRATLPESFKPGDALLLRFKVRCLETLAESGVGQIGTLVEMGQSPYTKTIWARFPAVSEWKELFVPGRVGRDYGKGELNLNLRLGYDAQTIEIKDLQLLRLPRDTELSTLPATTPEMYEGHEAEADWRRKAQVRIEKYRKQDVRIVVTDASGNPVPNATVRLEQTRHAFGFGTAISIKQVLAYSDAADTAMYQSILLNNFDTCGTENDLKWPTWTETRERTLHGLEWLQQNGMTQMRGHVLLWPTFNRGRTPDYLSEAASDPDRLRQLIMEHVKDILVATGPYVQEWDVINEPRTNHDILDLLGGESFMVEVFKEARKWLPQGRLFLNEALTFSPDFRIGVLESTAQYLLDEGAPIDGIGIQCHYNGWVVTPPAQIIETLDRLEELGLDIEVTEFDIDTANDDFQAAYLRDFYTAAFSHPSVTGIQMWGFWEGRHWKPTAALWTLDWKIRPAGRAYLDLVRGEWWTQTSGQTGSDGAWNARGFKGDYRITTLIGEKVVDTREASLDESPLNLEIQTQQ